MAHVCPYCGEDYSRREHLERHITKHTGVKPHRCDFCCLSYARKDLLQRHIATYHEPQAADLEQSLAHTPLGQTPIACETCASAKTGCDKLVPCSRCKQRGLTCVPRFARRTVKMKMAARAEQEQSGYYGHPQHGMSAQQLHGPFVLDSGGFGPGAVFANGLGFLPEPHNTVSWPAPLDPSASMLKDHLLWVDNATGEPNWPLAFDMLGNDADLMQPPTRPLSSTLGAPITSSVPSGTGLPWPDGNLLNMCRTPSAEQCRVLFENSTVRISPLEELQCRVVAMQEKITELELKVETLDTLVKQMNKREMADVDDDH